MVSTCLLKIWQPAKSVKSAESDCSVFQGAKQGTLSLLFVIILYKFFETTLAKDPCKQNDPFTPTFARISTLSELHSEII